ncbi:MAG: hypothetical protein GWN86_21580 [Desulfobacterales bacterium]|nr:hypothetical protein [Desulfobacterales bacterium]
MAKYDPDKHHRRSIRLQGYDYKQPGAYFVTICTHNRELLLEPGPLKQMVRQCWERLPRKFPQVALDEFVVMPNHVHGIISIVGVEHGKSVGADPCVCPDQGRTSNTKGEHMGSPLRERPTLGLIVQWFKTMTTNAYIRGVENKGWPPFPGRLWQRNYYEHIIRDSAHGI